MNYLIYLKAVGKNQGLISEKCSTKESIFTVHPAMKMKYMLLV